jgi:large subunit ribosomal protein L17
MRHRKAGRTLGRTSGQRRSLYRNLITDLFRHERVQTTEAKARAIRRHAEKLITLSRRGQTDRILELIRDNDQTTLANLIQKRRAQKLFAMAGGLYGAEIEDDAEGTRELSPEERQAAAEALEDAVRAMGVSARRQAAARLNGPDIVRKLFDEIGPRYLERPGGYTRILKLGYRKGDAAPMALIELVTD